MSKTTDELKGHLDDVDAFTHTWRDEGFSEPRELVDGVFTAVVQVHHAQALALKIRDDLLREGSLSLCSRRWDELRTIVLSAISGD